ncbi:DUF6527 family protein [Novosphingobium sp.]|uniref:DUF6527 family protein n=1 Tax=Novosphingobium sp. TaxID=1874826 RepID=UPI00260583B8|nr:DUF6527 family protein [Novosphingobium sp.]
MRAIPVEDIRSDEGQQPGAIELRRLDGEVKGIAFRCPCGCGYESWLPIKPDERGWQWNGNAETPTLTPSILQSGLPCKWHGYLTAGEFVSC